MRRNTQTSEYIPILRSMCIAPLCDFHLSVKVLLFFRQLASCLNAFCEATEKAQTGALSQSPVVMASGELARCP